MGNCASSANFGDSMMGCGCVWVSDEHRVGCYNCEKPFKKFTSRRHHCRICGELFCNTKQKPQSQNGGEKGVAVTTVNDSCWGTTVHLSSNFFPPDVAAVIEEQLALRRAREEEKAAVLMGSPPAGKNKSAAGGGNSQKANNSNRPNGKKASNSGGSGSPPVRSPKTSELRETPLLEEEGEVPASATLISTRERKFESVIAKGTPLSNKAPKEIVALAKLLASSEQPVCAVCYQIMRTPLLKTLALNVRSLLSDRDPHNVFVVRVVLHGVTHKRSSGKHDHFISLEALAAAERCCHRQKKKKEAMLLKAKKEHSNNATTNDGDENDDVTPSDILEDLVVTMMTYADGKVRPVQRPKRTRVDKQQPKRLTLDGSNENANSSSSHNHPNHHDDETRTLAESMTYMVKLLSISTDNEKLARDERKTQNGNVVTTVITNAAAKTNGGDGSSSPAATTPSATAPQSPIMTPIVAAGGFNSNTNNGSGGGGGGNGGNKTLSSTSENDALLTNDPSTPNITDGERTDFFANGLVLFGASHYQQSNNYVYMSPASRRLAMANSGYYANNNNGTNNNGNNSFAATGAVDYNDLSKFATSTANKQSATTPDSSKAPQFPQVANAMFDATALGSSSAATATTAPFPQRVFGGSGYYEISLEQWRPFNKQTRLVFRTPDAAEASDRPHSFGTVGVETHQTVKLRKVYASPKAAAMAAKINQFEEEWAAAEEREKAEKAAVAAAAANGATAGAEGSLGSSATNTFSSTFASRGAGQGRSSGAMAFSSATAAAGGGGDDDYQQHRRQTHFTESVIERSGGPLGGRGVRRAPPPQLPTTAAAAAVMSSPKQSNNNSKGEPSKKTFREPPPPSRPLAGNINNDDDADVEDMDGEDDGCVKGIKPLLFNQKGGGGEVVDTNNIHIHHSRTGSFGSTTSAIASPAKALHSKQRLTSPTTPNEKRCIRDALHQHQQSIIDEDGDPSSPAADATVVVSASAPLPVPAASRHGGGGGHEEGGEEMLPTPPRTPPMAARTAPLAPATSDDASSSSPAPATVAGAAASTSSATNAAASSPSPEASPASSGAAKVLSKHDGGGGGGGGTGMGSGSESRPRVNSIRDSRPRSEWDDFLPCVEDFAKKAEAEEREKSKKEAAVDYDISPKAIEVIVRKRPMTKSISSGSLGGGGGGGAEDATATTTSGNSPSLGPSAVAVVAGGGGGGLTITNSNAAATHFLRGMGGIDKSIMREFAEQVAKLEQQQQQQATTTSASNSATATPRTKGGDNDKNAGFVGVIANSKNNNNNNNNNSTSRQNSNLYSNNNSLSLAPPGLGGGGGPLIHRRAGSSLRLSSNPLMFTAYNPQARSGIMTPAEATGMATAGGDNNSVLGGGGYTVTNFAAGHQSYGNLSMMGGGVGAGATKSRFNANTKDNTVISVANFNHDYDCNTEAKASALKKRSRKGKRLMDLTLNIDERQLEVTMPASWSLGCSSIVGVDVIRGEALGESAAGNSRSAGETLGETLVEKQKKVLAMMKREKEEKEKVAAAASTSSSSPTAANTTNNANANAATTNSATVKGSSMRSTPSAAIAAALSARAAQQQYALTPIGQQYTSQPVIVPCGVAGKKYLRIETFQEIFYFCIGNHPYDDDDVNATSASPNKTTSRNTTTNNANKNQRQQSPSSLSVPRQSNLHSHNHDADAMPVSGALLPSGADLMTTAAFFNPGANGNNNTITVSSANLTSAVAFASEQQQQQQEDPLDKKAAVGDEQKEDKAQDKEDDCSLPAMPINRVVGAIRHPCVGALAIETNAIPSVTPGYTAQRRLLDKISNENELMVAVKKAVEISNVRGRVRVSTVKLLKAGEENGPSGDGGGGYSPPSGYMRQQTPY